MAGEGKKNKRQSKKPHKNNQLIIISTKTPLPWHAACSEKGKPCLAFQQRLQVVSPLIERKETL